jgi:hypothetical protein
MRAMPNWIKLLVTVSVVGVVLGLLLPARYSPMRRPHSRELSPRPPVPARAADEPASRGVRRQELVRVAEPAADAGEIIKLAEPPQDGRIHGLAFSPRLDSLVAAFACATC